MGAPASLNAVNALIVQSRPEASRADATPDREPLLRGVRVLLVEDHLDTLSTYQEGLRQLGADVATATTAQMGLMALERRAPHVLVVDIGLPDVDGNEFLLKVRSRRPREGWDTPAIALTAYNSPQDRLRTVDAGFRMHVVKPVDPAYLGQLVADLARGRAG